jgi:hypothetical protein
MEQVQLTKNNFKVKLALTIYTSPNQLLTALVEDRMKWEPMLNSAKLASKLSIEVKYVGSESKPVMINFNCS